MHQYMYTHAFISGASCYKSAPGDAEVYVQEAWGHRDRRHRERDLLPEPRVLRSWLWMNPFVNVSNRGLEEKWVPVRGGGVGGGGEMGRNEQ